MKAYFVGGPEDLTCRVLYTETSVYYFPAYERLTTKAPEEIQINSGRHVYLLKWRNHDASIGVFIHDGIY